MGAVGPLIELMMCGYLRSHLSNGFSAEDKLADGVGYSGILYGMSSLIPLIEDRHLGLLHRIEEHFFERAAPRTKVANLFSRARGGLPQQLRRLACGEFHQQRVVVGPDFAAAGDQLLGERSHVGLQTNFEALLMNLLEAYCATHKQCLK